MSTSNPSVTRDESVTWLWSLPLLALAAWVVLHPAFDVRLGQGLARSMANRVHGFLLGQFQDIRSERIQHHHGKAQAKAPTDDAGSQDLSSHDLPIGLELERQVWIGNIASFTQLGNKVFRPKLVILTALHFSQSCIVFDAFILNVFKRPLDLEFEAFV